MTIGAVKVFKIFNDAILPQRKSDLAVGYDVCAHNIKGAKGKGDCLDREFFLEPKKSVIIGTGLVISVPQGYELQVRPRAGLSIKSDIIIPNSPGTVDPDYTGELGIIFKNTGNGTFKITKGMRIAQILFKKAEIPGFEIVDSIKKLQKTTRGEGGFGSTGLFGPGFGTSKYDSNIAKIDRYCMGVVLEISKLSNCIRGCEEDSRGVFPKDKDGYFIGQTRRLGCVIARGDQIIASGFNCQYPGSPLCSEVGCLRDELNIPSGEQIEKCRAMHAEQVAIISALESGIALKDTTMYVNAEPCLICAKLIAGLKTSGLGVLVVLEDVYPTNGLDIVREAGILVRKIKL